LCNFTSSKKNKKDRFKIQSNILKSFPISIEKT
jgi:hypothetical protein